MQVNNRLWDVIVWLIITRKNMSGTLSKCTIPMKERIGESTEVTRYVQTVSDDGRERKHFCYSSLIHNELDETIE